MIQSSKKKMFVLLLLSLYNIALILVCFSIYIVSINVSLMLSISRWYILAILVIYSLSGILLLSLLAVDYFVFKYGLIWLIDKWWKKRNEL